MKPSFLDQSIGYSINMGGMLLKRELIAIFKKNGYDITPEQWALLSRLNEADGINQNELAMITFKDNANITRIVDKLISKKLVEKSPDVRDGRAWLLHITKSGRILVSKLEPLALKLLQQVTVGISKQEVELCNRVIQKIMKNLA